MIDANNALALARDAFSGSTMYFDANIRPELEQDLRAFQSKHPSGSKYNSDGYRGRAKFFRPKTRALVRSAEATGTTVCVIVSSHTCTRWKDWPASIPFTRSTGSARSMV